MSENDKNRIKSVLEYTLDELTDGINNGNFENSLEANIERFHGKENVKWMLIYEKASTITVELGDDFYFKTEDLIIEREMNFTIKIFYKSELVFETFNGVKQQFLENDEWINLINELYKKI